MIMNETCARAREDFFKKFGLGRPLSSDSGPFFKK